MDKKKKMVGTVDTSNPQPRWHKTTYLEDGVVKKTIHDGTFDPFEISYTDLNPNNITVTVDGESLIYEFDVNAKVMNYIIANEPEWAINVLSVGDIIDFVIYKTAIDEGDISYSNGHFTITNDWIGIDPYEVQYGTYNDGFITLVNTVDGCEFANLTVTVIA